MSGAIGGIANSGSRPMSDVLAAQTQVKVRQADASGGNLSLQMAAQKAEKAEKIRNREEPCPSCRERKYQDKSDDSGVSFQAARGVPASSAGVTVIRHEQEHVTRNDTKPGERENGAIKSSRVTLQYDCCPDCGRRYVSGGLTKTNTLPVYGQKEDDRLIRIGHAGINIYA